MMEEINKLLNANVNNIALGNITLGTSLKSFIEKMLSSKHYYDGSLKMNAIFPSYITYTYFDSIAFWFSLSLKSPLLTRIDLYNNYKGLFINKLEIGSNLFALDELTFSFDEDRVFLDAYPNVIITVSEDLTTLNSQNEINSSIIEEFSIRN